MKSCEENGSGGWARLLKPGVACNYSLILVFRLLIVAFKCALKVFNSFADSFPNFRQSFRAEEKEYND